MKKYRLRKPRCINQNTIWLKTYQEVMPEYHCVPIPKERYGNKDWNDFVMSSFDRGKIGIFE